MTKKIQEFQLMYETDPGLFVRVPNSISSTKRSEVVSWGVEHARDIIGEYGDDNAVSVQIMKTAGTLELGMAAVISAKVIP